MRLIICTSFHWQIEPAGNIRSTFASLPDERKFAEAKRYYSARIHRMPVLLFSGYGNGRQL